MLFTNKIKYLGFIVSKDGVSTYSKKIEVVLNWPTPRNVKEVQGFLGLTRWYCIFIESYASKASPMTSLLKKVTIFMWTTAAQESFELLKLAFVTAPVLQLPNFKKKFIVIIDTSIQAIGGVLQQEGKPVAYEFRKLRQHELNYATHDLE